ncbi:hypothetical protein LAZ67_2005447 [Cordylochernes scorpioides]|uniref:Integrase catalytic domain-containing protein n=1 Tax=Cordylochernes scorpioides TaxID=51811 RepID=A0ABY6K5C6_9ARAC|nr:hypothetical protein LAZ67_2005447 [Cordylochernes scorpioides]
MTAQRYVDDVLRPVTLPYLQGVPNALYQQDNARPHTARISQQALKDVQMLPWPPYSSELSPIEHVWDIIGRRLHALPQPRSEDELWQMSVVAVNFLEHSVGFSGTFLPVEGEQQNFPQMGTFWLGNRHFPRAPEIFHDLNFSKTARMLMPQTVQSSLKTEVVSRTAESLVPQKWYITLQNPWLHRYGTSYRGMIGSKERIISGVEASIKDLSHQAKSDIRKRISSVLMNHTTQNPQARMERTIMKRLKDRSDIIICNSDKGSQTAVMDTSTYRSKMMDVLADESTFIPIDEDTKLRTYQDFRRALLEQKILSQINSEECKLFTSRLTTDAYIYGLPKIHKPNVPLRPIIACHRSPSAPLARGEHRRDIANRCSEKNLIWTGGNPYQTRMDCDGKDSSDGENLWKLDAIGVSDAEVEKKTQSLQAEMEEHFAHTTTRDIDGAMRWNHETHGHAGLQTLLGILRENNWILRSRKTVKKIINQCIRCNRFTATPATVESTSLPEDRVRDAAVFEIVGVDLTGHLILKNKKKAWIVILTCAVYRGVHLELVTSLSMETFLQAFRRFIARRGRPLIVYSDNGTNFRGMANTLKKIDFSRLKCDPTLKNITWKFIPPGAPWWGGWWERLIGMKKQLLFRILGQTSLGYEELSTVMCDVESLMNTRPLTYLTEESEDLVPLTPSLFLHEVREVGVPDMDLIDNQTITLKYQYIKRVREDLRERFRIEYFEFRRQETRRLKTTIPFKVGDMVLIGQESLKRLHWPLARIIQLYPGKDGLVRVTKVKISSGDKIRPIPKLYNLEITPEIRCRDPLTERSHTQEVRLTTEEDPLTSQQGQHHIGTPNVVSRYGRHIKRTNRLDLLNISFPCLSRRGANSKVGEMLEKKEFEAANGRPTEAATGMQRLK